jgi:membrane-bound lytic murein transglycosylase B
VHRCPDHTGLRLSVQPPASATRQAFFRGELEQLPELHARTGRDPAALRGSYAGAMGWPQFMPSSWLRYAIDFDGDGRGRPVQQPGRRDRIGGQLLQGLRLANRHAHPLPRAALERSAPGLPTLLAPDILPTFEAVAMESLGVLSAAGRQHTGPLALVELENGDAPRSYVAGTENFYVVTRYNWSSYYALAVIELGETIQAMMTARSAGR